MSAKEFLKYFFLSIILSLLVIVLIQHDAFAPVQLFVSCFFIYIWLKVMFFEDRGNSFKKKISK